MIFSILVLVILRTHTPLSQRIKKMALEVLKGILTIKSIQSKSLFLITTTVMWLTYFLMSYMIFFALEETSSLSLTAGFMLLVSGGHRFGFTGPRGYWHLSRHDCNDVGLVRY